MPLLKGRFRPATASARFSRTQENEGKNEVIKCTVVLNGPTSLQKSENSAFRAPRSVSPGSRPTIVVGRQPPSPFFAPSPRKIPTTPFSPSSEQSSPQSFIPRAPSFCDSPEKCAVKGDASAALEHDPVLSGVTESKEISQCKDNFDNESIVSEGSSLGSEDFTSSSIVRKKGRKVEIDRSTMTISDIINMRVSRSSNKTGNPLSKIWSDIKEREKRNLAKQEEKEISEKERIARLIKEAEDRGDILTEDQVLEKELPPIEVQLDEEGNIVVNEKSLVVEHESNTVIEETVEEDNNELGFGRYEDYKTNLYSFSKRKKTTAKRWTNCETEKFYMALRKVGTDFELMSRIMPGFSRDMLKKKFKREEKLRLAKIDLALKHSFKINDVVMEKEAEDDSPKKPQKEKPRKRAKREKKQRKRKLEQIHETDDEEERKEVRRDTEDNENSCSRQVGDRKMFQVQPAYIDPVR